MVRHGATPPGARISLGGERYDDHAAAPIGFLNLLDCQIVAHPERLRPVLGTLLERGQELVRGIESTLMHLSELRLRCHRVSNSSR